MKISTPKFLWYDFWVGAFYDREKHCLYLCLLPCIVIKVEFGICGHHRYSGWIENLGRYATGKRYRMCLRPGCGHIEMGE